jgi:hypothetical protein
MGLAALVMGIGILATGQATADAGALVGQLGSARYGERQAATEALEKLGVEALPALRAARGSEDPEVRQRVRAILSRIESERMVRATMLRLDFVDRPLPEVVSEIAQKSGIALQLMPPDPVAWRGRRVTLKSEVAVPFWAALDQLCEAAQVRPVPNMGGMAEGRGGLVLSTGSIGEAGPTSDRGPFRTVITQTNYHVVRSFGSALGTPFEPALVIGPNGRPLVDAARPGAAGAEGRRSVSFGIEAQILVEPRMAVVQTGPPRLTAAVDDLGQSLVPTEGVPGAGGMRSGMVMGGVGGLQISIALKPPERFGSRIVDLEGTVPVIATARKDEPLVIPLAGAVGKTFESEDASVTIHAVDPAPNNPPGGTLVELSIRPKATVGDNPAEMGGGGLMAQGQFLGLTRMPGSGQGPIEVADAQGRIYRQWFPRSSQANMEEIRMTLALLSSEGVGPPAEIRYYGMSRTPTEVGFHFKDVPMP